MARRNKQAKPVNPWPLIILFLLPLALLAGLMILINSAPRKGGAEIRDEMRRKADVAAAITAAGAGFETNSAGIHVVTLPSAEALSITSRAAKELALTTQSRLGGNVRVQTPAGQVLAEAP